MVLTVDVGNTNIVFGGFEGDTLRFTSRIRTDKYQMLDEYAVKFLELIRFYGFQPSDFDGAIISSVVPPLIPVLKSAIAQILPVRVLVVSPGIKTGLNIKLDDPAIMGADLVCGAVGALVRYPTPCIIADLGTATKLLVLGEDGSFLGGTIMPGVNISLDALSKNTALLPHIEFGKVERVIGTNTIDCMLSGVLFGTASMIDGMVDRIEEELGQKASVVMTGGIAKSIAPYCRRQYAFDENLLLYGLIELYRRNTRKKAPL